MTAKIAIQSNVGLGGAAEAPSKSHLFGSAGNMCPNGGHSWTIENRSVEIFERN